MTFCIEFDLKVILGELFHFQNEDRHFSIRPQNDAKNMITRRIVISSTKFAVYTNNHVHPPVSPSVRPFVPLIEQILSES